MDIFNPHPDDIRRYTDADTRFLFGADLDHVEDVFRARKHQAGRLWKRTLADAGVDDELARVEVDLDTLPDDKITVQVSPESTRVGNITIGLDLTSVLSNQFKMAWDADARFEKASGRWRKVPDRVRGYIPSDAGSIRWTLLPSRLFDGTDFDMEDRWEIERRITAAEGAAWAYMATPHFIPATVALDVVTATPPPPQALAEARLPQRYVMVFHDGIPLTVVAGADDDIAAYAGSSMVRDESLLIGGILSSEDDGSLYRECAYLLVARRSVTSHYGWSPVRVAYGDHPAGKVLANYAALLSWEGWAAPPPIPAPKDGKGLSGNQLKKIARSQAGQDGAWHRVRVLDYRPPAPDEVPPEPRPRTGQGRQRRHAGWRRAYWTTRKRYGIRDKEDRLVGPVYGPDAVEGVTFERRRRLVRSTVTRPDLPPPPGGEVYRIPADTHPAH